MHTSGCREEGRAPSSGPRARIGSAARRGLGEECDLLCERLQQPERARIAVDDHVDLEALVLALEERLLVLVLAHVLEGRAFFGADRDAHPLQRVTECSN